MELGHNDNNYIDAVEDLYREAADNPKSKL